MILPIFIYSGRGQTRGGNCGPIITPEIASRAAALADNIKKNNAILRKISEVRK